MKSQLNVLRQVMFRHHSCKAVHMTRPLSCMPHLCQGKQSHQQAVFPRPTRCFHTSHTRARELFLPGNIIQSPMEDLTLPENMTMHDLIFEKCDLHKDKPAITDAATGKTYTFTELKDKSIRVASALTRKGYKKGDVILAFSTNQVDFSVLMLATSSLGIWFTAANPAYIADELARQLTHSEAKAVFVLPPFLPVMEDALKKQDFPNKVQDRFVFGESPGWQPFQSLMEDDGTAFPDVSFDVKEDVFALPYSSGTTGLPKGVMLSHHNVVSNLLQMDPCNGIEEDDKVLGLLPLYHAYAQLVTQFASFYTGGHIYYLTHFEPQMFLSCLQDKEITYANLVPPLILFLTKHPIVEGYDLSKLRYVTCAAAPLGKELTDDFLKKFPQVTLNQGYGLTEASPALSLDRWGENTGSVGSLVPNTLAKIVDLETGENLGPGKEGEMVYLGPQVMKGYFKNPEATKEMVKEDGWMHTGDIGYYDEQGLFYVSDRLKELIKYKGLQVAPAELEAILLGHPEIADACVVGVPDEKAGEVPKAFVVKQANAEITEETVAQYIEGQVSSHKKLRGGVEFINEIPKNPSGKILRRLLRK